MCNRYANDPDIQAKLSTWREYIGWDLVARTPPARDVWPRHAALVARREAGRGRVDVMNWGVPLSLPGKRPGTKITKYVTNVRNLESPFWRDMLARPEQRCLVPFTRFAERGAGGETWFALARASAGAFAGLWRESDQGPVFAFLTCAPNALVGAVHPKAMPVILAPADHQRWLSGSLSDVSALARPYPDDAMIITGPPEVATG